MILAVGSKRLLSFWLSLLTFCLLTSCAHEEILFNRRHLQDPLMDPAKTSGASETLLQTMFSAHDFGSQGAALSGSGTCPTCGG